MIDELCFYTFLMVIPASRLKLLLIYNNLSISSFLWSSAFLSGSSHAFTLYDGHRKDDVILDLAVASLIDNHFDRFA